MNPSKTTGLGEPEPIGKKSLFQPPAERRSHPASPTDQSEEPSPPKETHPDQRVRMTLEITKKSLAIIQELQGKYRLETGHPLPKWKLISASLELYAKARKGKGNETKE